MREIKFRAWVESGDYKEMLPNVQRHIGAATGFGHLLQNTAKGYEKVYVMQYTGIKDKNGVEIYEGDVVMMLYTDWPSMNGDSKLTLGEYLDSISNIGKVIFKDCKFCIQFNKDGYTDSIHCGRHGRIKVIGSIYQNPELIGDK